MTEPKRIYVDHEPTSGRLWASVHEDRSRMVNCYPYLSASYLLSEEVGSLSDRMARFMCRWADAPTGGPSFDYAKEQFRAALEAALKEG